MRYRLLGNSGLQVSEAALGTMTFGEEWGWGSTQDEARKVYDAFREAGGNFIDTANMYTNGTSESFLGEFMKGHRESVVMATKYTNAVPGTDQNAAGNQRKNMVQAVEASLKRLKTDYIDLYWVHIWDQMTPVEEVMRALDDLVRIGKVLYVGISDAPAWWIAQANTLAHLRGWSPLHRVADRIQPDRAGAGPDGQGAPPRLDRVVATGQWCADRQVPRPRVVRAGPYERRHDEAIPAGAATGRPRRRGRQDCVR
jgi:aryl-alcohol dehydrogenase-like predicted oxidoreductase